MNKFPNTVDFANGAAYAQAVDMPYQLTDDLQPGVVHVANDDRFTQGTSSQPLTTFAVGGWGNTGIERELALYTGQRLGDVLDMHMSRIQDKTVSVRQEKTDKFLRIPLHRELMPIVEECRQRGSLFLVSRVDGTQFTVDQFHAMWGREMARSETKRIRAEGYVFHGLRKSATVKLAEAGCTNKQIQAVTGMSLPMIEHYSKEADQLQLAKEAIRKVERT